MDYKLISENWKKFLNEFQAQHDPGVGGGGAGPLTWDEIRRKCEGVWTGKRIEACYFKSVRGLPSVAQIIKMVSKDKDILATLGDLENGEVDLEFNYAEPKTTKDGIRPAGTAKVDLNRESSSGRVITIYLDSKLMSGMHDTASRIFYSLRMGIKTWNANYYRYLEDPRNYFLKRYGSEALDYWAQGAISRDRLDNFINLWGFTILLNNALIFVHEMAHVFDPDSISNLYSNEEEFNRFFHAHTDWDPDSGTVKWPYNSRAFRFARTVKKYLRTDDQIRIDRKEAEKVSSAWQKLKNSMSGRAEMFATNRSHDFTADLEDSELLKLAYSPASAGGPTNLSASGVNIEKFSLMTSLTPPPTKDDVSRDSDIKAGLVRSMNNRYQNLLWNVYGDGQRAVPELATQVIAHFIQWQEGYSRTCSKRLHMMSKDIQLDIYGVAGGESDDRLAPDSYEDRKYITRTKRQSNREKGLDESKKKIKINIV